MTTVIKVVGTGDSTQVRSTDRVSIVSGVQGVAGRDGTVFRWMGAWDPAVTYVLDDAVYEEDTGASWLCLSTNLNDQPSDGSGAWSALADPRKGIENHKVGAVPEHDNFQNRIGWPKDELSDAYFTTLAYDSNTRAVTLTSAGNDSLPLVTSFDPATDWRFYINGVRHIKTGPVSLVHSATEGGYFFYYDENGDFVVTTTPWELQRHAPVAYVYYSGTEGIGYEERHTIYVDSLTHEALHFSIGTFIQSGFNLTDYSLDQGDDAGIRWGLAAGVVRDEDLATAVAAIATGNYTHAYREGVTGAFTFAQGQDDPVIANNVFAEWNEFTGSTWQTTEAANGDRVNYFIFATPGIDPAKQVLIVPGQAVHATLQDAEAEVLEALDMGGLVAQEIAGIWRITFRLNSANTSYGKAQIEQVDQIFAARSGSVTASAPTDHQTLAHRSQPGSHPAAAVTFTPAGNIAAVELQAALEELDAEKLQNDRSEFALLPLSGSATTPAVSFGASGHGVGAVYGHILDFAVQGTTRATLGATGRLAVALAGSFEWAAAYSGADLRLQRDAAGVLALKNGAVAQEFRIYNSDSGGDYERGFLKWNSNVLEIGTDLPGGGGSARPMSLMYSGSSRLSIVSDAVELDVNVFRPSTAGYDLGETSKEFGDLYLNGQVLGAVGSISAPTHSFQGTPNYGMYYDSGAVRFSINGAQEFWIAASAVGPGVNGGLDIGTSGFKFASGYIQAVEVDSGSVSAPALRPGGNTDAGFYFPSGDTYKPYVVWDGVSQGRVLGHLHKAALHIMGGNIPSPTGIATFTVRRSEIVGTVKSVFALVTGGTSVTLNCAQDGNNLRSADLVVTAGAGWVDFGTLQNASLGGGDVITIEVVAVSGTPSEVAFQIEVEPLN